MPQETAVELIFAAHSTTASASTSLILQLLRHPAVVDRARAELEAEGLGYQPNSANVCTSVLAETEVEAEQSIMETSRLLTGDKSEAAPQPRSHVPTLSLENLTQLCYVDCIVKEVLRFLPPVSGGYRTALKTFELDVSSRHKTDCVCDLPEGKENRESRQNLWTCTCNKMISLRSICQVKYFEYF